MKVVYDGDALWGACPDGGDIHFVDGEPTRSGGLAGAAYISLFGGNEMDDGTPESKAQYWGNFVGGDEPIRSRLDTLLRSIPMSTSNLTLIEETAALDLAWMVAQGIATEVNVTASIERARWLNLDIQINNIAQSPENFRYRVNWASGPFEPELVCA